MHLKALFPSTQVPPFSHGDEEQSLRSRANYLKNFLDSGFVETERKGSA